MALSRSEDVGWMTDAGVSPTPGYVYVPHENECRCRSRTTLSSKNRRRRSDATSQRSSIITTGGSGSFARFWLGCAVLVASATKVFGKVPVRIHEQLNIERGLRSTHLLSSNGRWPKSLTMSSLVNISFVNNSSATIPISFLFSDSRSLH